MDNEKVEIYQNYINKVYKMLNFVVGLYDIL